MEKQEFSKERDPYNVSERMQEAIENLKITYKIDNLSNIELFHLKKITEDVIERAQRDNDQSDLAKIDPQQEIPVRFLQELYGITLGLIEENFEHEKDEEAFLEFIRRKRDQAHLI